MPLYSVVYTKTNSIFKGQLDIYKMDEYGSKVPTGKYKSKGAPGAIQTPRIHFKEKGANRGWQMSLSDEEVSDLLTKAGSFFDDDDNMITKANRLNPRDPFYTHMEFFLKIHGGSTTLDTDHPVDALHLGWIRKDRRFLVRGEGEESNPVVTSLVEYTVTSASTKNKDAEREVNEGLLASELLQAMDFTKQRKVLAAFGVRMIDPDPNQVKAALWNRITKIKDDTLATGERNIDAFIRLANASTEDLNLNYYFEQAYTLGIIVKKAGNRYFFSDFELGTSKDKAKATLNSPDYSEQMKEIIDAVNDKIK